MLTLKHGDTVRLATWAHPYDRTTATVGTVRAYCANYGESPDAAFAKARSLGHATAWTTYVGGALLGSASERAAQRERELAALARAVILADGDTVQIEGGLYAVLVVPGNLKGPRNCDPIKFIPVAG